MKFLNDSGQFLLGVIYSQLCTNCFKVTRHKTGIYDSTGRVKTRCPSCRKVSYPPEEFRLRELGALTLFNEFEGD